MIKRKFFLRRSKMKTGMKWLVGVWVVVMLAGGVLPAQANLITNGDFSSGLSSWNTDGNVTAGSGFVELSDNPLSDTYTYGSISQGANVTLGGKYLLTFDFQTGIDPTSQTPEGSFSDYFGATLYYGSIPSTSYAALLDINGLSSDPILGSISSSSNIGWSTVSYSFTALDALLFPIFDFSDSDGYEGSYARVANVSLTESSTPVPEPSTILLLAGGVFSLMMIRNRRKGHNV